VPPPVSILSQLNPVVIPRSISPHPISWRSALILSSHLRLGLSSGLFPQVFPPKPCTHLSPPIYALHARPARFSRSHHPHNSGWGVHIFKLLIIKFSPLPCYLDSPRPKYSSHHPILKHPQLYIEYWLKLDISVNTLIIYWKLGQIGSVLHPLHDYYTLHSWTFVVKCWWKIVAQRWLFVLDINTDKWKQW
jgi:hypothetical protein